MVIIRYFPDFCDKTLLISCDQPGLECLAQTLVRCVELAALTNLATAKGIEVTGNSPVFCGPFTKTVVDIENHDIRLLINPTDLPNLHERMMALSGVSDGHVYGSDLECFDGEIELKVSVGEYPREFFDR